jgi:hypothetical protein
MSKKKLARWWTDDDAYATTLLEIAVTVFGDELFEWDPETIPMEIAAEFQVSPTSGPYNKLMAGIQLVTTDSFYRSLPDFINLCNVLSHGYIDSRLWDPADALEIAWGVTESLLIWPPDPRDEKPFSDDIIGYIGFAVRSEGIMVPPDVLRLGVREDDNIWDMVQGEFSDDPTMFAAIYDMEMSKTEEINQEVKRRLVQLLQQLDSTGLHGESSEDTVKQMLKALQEQSEEGSELKPVQY